MLCIGNYWTESEGKEFLEEQRKQYTTVEAWEKRSELIRIQILKGAGLEIFPEKCPLNPIFGDKRTYKAILQTAETMAPDFTVLFHGGANSKPHLAGVGYLFEQVKEEIREFQKFIADEFIEENFSLGGNGVDESNTKSFNFTSAITHVSGTPALTFESNQGLNYLEEGKPWIVIHTYDEIYKHHMLTIEGLCKFLLK